MNVRRPHDTAWYARRDALFTGGNEVTLLTGGDELFPAMQAAIDAARHEVWLATYIFHDDVAGRTLADVLQAAARRGVRVRVVVDGFGSKASLPALRRWFDGSGVALAVFRPIDRWYSWLQPGQLRRLHQKLWPPTPSRPSSVASTSSTTATTSIMAPRASRGWTSRWRCVARWSSPWPRRPARCGPAPRSAATGATK